MESQLTLPENYEEICNNISDMISTTRKGVFQAVNTAHVMLNWNIGKKLRIEILKNQKQNMGNL